MTQSAVCYPNSFLLPFISTPVCVFCGRVGTQSINQILTACCVVVVLATGVVGTSMSSTSQHSSLMPVQLPPNTFTCTQLKTKSFVSIQLHTLQDWPHSQACLKIFKPGLIFRMGLNGPGNEADSWTSFCCLQYGEQTASSQSWPGVVQVWK